MEQFIERILHILKELDPDPVFYAPPFFIALILIELLISWRGGLKLYHTQEAFSSIAMGLGVLFIGLPMKIIAFVVFSALYKFAPDAAKTFLDYHNWPCWVLILFADDLSFYWHHRLSHTVRLLWAAHVNHHSSQTLNFATALRQSWTEVFYKYIFWLWLPLVGFHPYAIMSMMSISLIYQFLQHTDLVGKLGPLEWIFNTPSHHRVHHASNVKYLDRNHAGILIIWDRMFGSFTEEDDKDKPIYGIRTNIETYNPFKIATHEFVNIWRDVKRARNFGEILGYVFGPPGWSPDGSSQTTSQLRKADGLD